MNILEKQLVNFFTEKLFENIKELKNTNTHEDLYEYLIKIYLQCKDRDIFEIKCKKIFLLVDINSPNFSKKYKEWFIGDRKIPFNNSNENDFIIENSEYWTDFIQKEKYRRLHGSVLKLTANSNFKCPNCGNRNSHQSSVQKKSGDEGSTNILVCITCGHNWQFS